MTDAFRTYIVYMCWSPTHTYKIKLYPRLESKFDFLYVTSIPHKRLLCNSYKVLKLHYLMESYLKGRSLVIQWVVIIRIVVIMNVILMLNIIFILGIIFVLVNIRVRATLYKDTPSTFPCRFWVVRLLQQLSIYAVRNETGINLVSIRVI